MINEFLIIKSSLKEQVKSKYLFMLERMRYYNIKHKFDNFIPFLMEMLLQIYDTSSEFPVEYLDFFDARIDLDYLLFTKDINIFNYLTVLDKIPLNDDVEIKLVKDVDL